MNSYVLGWLVLGAILALLEFIVPGAILGFIGLSCAIVAALMHFGFIEGVVETLLAWFAISIFCILVVRTFCLKLMPGDSEIEDTDEDNDAVGCIAVVSDRLGPHAIGRIRFRETTWQALCDTIVEEGENVKIIGREGNAWKVEPY